ncbi:MAG TPA: tetratricopeptide repeat protein [Candidatus Hydrogenedentes bacterium]|nr:tetratricopeptide repeat protein [Candidatus Hydrogenedentota bacterium]
MHVTGADRSEKRRNLGGAVGSVLLGVLLLMGTTTGRSIAEGDATGTGVVPETVSPAPVTSADREGYPVLAGLDPSQVTRRVRNYDRLQRIMAGWHEATGKKLYEAGERDQALEHARAMRAHLLRARTLYEEALRQSPRDPDLMNYYGELLYDKFGEQDRAVALWEEVLRVDTRHARAHNNLAIHDSHEGRYEQAVAHLDEAIKREPDNADYLYNLSQIYLVHWPQVMRIRLWSMDRLYDEAMELSRRAAVLRPRDLALQRDYALNFFLAENLSSKPDWKAAAKAWSKVREVARRPDDLFNAWLNEGRVWLRAEQVDRARKCFEAALAIRPDSQVARGLVQDAEDMKRAGRK